MSVATSTAIGIGLGVAGIGGSVASGIIGSNAAGHAADTQAASANQAALLQRQNAIDALNFQKQVYGDQQRNSLPFLQTGQGASMSLANLMGIRLPSSTGMTMLPQSPTTAPGGPTFSPGGIPGGWGGGRIRALLGNGDPTLGDSSTTAGGTGFQPFSANTAQVPMRSMMGQSATVPFRNPDIGTFGTGGNAPIQASTGNPGTVPMANPDGGTFMTSADGSPGMVPRLDSNLPDNPASFGALTRPFGEKFTAPTDVTEQNDPGFQFRLKQGTQALQQSAAARGGLLTGGTAKALEDYAQGTASNEYGNVYNRQLGEFQQKYNIYNNDQNTLFNRLSTLMGGGQTTAANLNSAGSSAANNTSNVLLDSGRQIGQDINNAGAARASGYIGGANATTGAIGGATNSLTNMFLLSQLMGGNKQPTGGTNPFANDPSICWIAEELYGVDSPKTHAVRAWLKNVYRFDPIGQHFVALYAKHGQAIAGAMKHDSELKASVKPLFDAFAEQAMGAPQAGNFETVRYQ